MAYTRQEREAIRRAWCALEYACSRTGDNSGKLNAAAREERKQASPAQDAPLTWAHALVIKRWAQGYDAPDSPCSRVADWRPGALTAFMLGADMATKYGADDGPRADATRRARDLATAAIEAYEAAWTRELDAIHAPVEV